MRKKSTELSSSLLVLMSDQQAQFPWSNIKITVRSSLPQDVSCSKRSTWLHFKFTVVNFWLCHGTFDILMSDQPIGQTSKYFISKKNLQFVFVILSMIHIQDSHYSEIWCITLKIHLYFHV